MWLHLSERVLRKYDYVHGIPSSPTVFGALEPEEIVTAFQDFLLHIIPQVDRCQEAVDQWRCRRGYMTWLYNVSHSIMSQPTPILVYLPPRPPIEELIIQKQYVRQLPDPLQFIGNISAKVEIALQYHEPHPYYHNVLMSV